MIAALPAQASDSPNFVVFLFDDLGYNDVGFNGSDIRTPEIDKLADSSLVFDQFYVFPWCSSTRAALETGINPAAFGMRSLEHNFKGGSAIPDSVPTLAQQLQARGYYNVFLGKWHLSKTFESGPLKKGYHYAYGYLSGQVDHIRHDDHTGKHVLFKNEVFISEKGHMTDLIFREASNTIANAGRPFFINVSFSAPHYPVQSLSAYEDQNGHIKNVDRRAYAGMVSHADRVIGQLIAQLRDSGQLGNTYIFVLSDNGGQMQWSNAKYYGGRFPGRAVMASNSPLRDSKTTAYEGGIRVPSIAYGSSFTQNRRTDTFATILDLVATILELSGAGKKSGGEGLNLAELGSGGLQREADFYWQTYSASIPHGGGSQEALRVENFKLIRSQQRFAWFPWRWRWPWDRYELYDLSKDTSETHDLSDEKPALLTELITKLEAKSVAYHDDFEEFLSGEHAKTN